MKQWEKLREIVLKTPTATKEDYQNFTISQSYIQMSEPADKYYYSQEERLQPDKNQIRSLAGFPVRGVCKSREAGQDSSFQRNDGVFHGKGACIDFCTE